MQVEISSSYAHGSRRQRRIRRTEETQKQKTMVAISMYRGNLHKVPDVPRRWRMPDHNLSFKDFKSLLHRRKRALSRLPLNSNPNLNLSVKTELVTDQENPIIPSEGNASSGKQKLVDVKREVIGGNRVKEDENNDRGFEGARSDGGDRPGRVTELKETDYVPQKDVAKEEEANETAEKVPSEIEKKQKEVEERLQVLNAKKHNLVQVLKQILNAEEELKRRGCMQQQGTTAATRPALPLHVDVSNDSGGNAGTHMEGGETDDAANQNNAQTRTVLRLCGASSSSESPLKRAAALSQHNMVPHTSRWSPRVGPSQPGPAVTVSASGTNYIASSPSPAGSGGTSVFRESRLQSPWN
ncbi:hypothetical protein ARALYDRAFT_485149 [Arabidopsis lyrata subsp. lyrata]|uniref:Uncharacterized protein n=1 Tax=Arabidopsis lyrata subsp. lyrata TaxID=81972 RepID=D7LRG3_ARALL|nr:hypothetical protein ARALYDRAFT_485149 [Arabidopsis lyrata subsp. lyrata]